MKVLCVCTMGQNRSKYLAEYLQGLGYETRYGGVGPCLFDSKPVNEVNPEDVEWADIIITARPKHKPILFDKYNTKNKRIITLDVSDSRKRVGKIYPDLLKINHAEFNRIWTYPQLEKAIAKYLPLENQL